MMPTFAARLVAWQKIHGRHHLPWQVADAYRVWLSEIMLQQTQVGTALPYFEAFTKRFANVAQLAAAELDEVLALWAGLGYYRRAHHLHHAARQVMQDFGGAFPSKRLALEQLKGVGRSTAAAIAVFAFNEREAILDGNVKRVLARHAGIFGAINRPATEKALWREAEARLPQNDLRAYTQGLMDLGNAVCVKSKPHCVRCPVAEDCYAYQHGKTTVLPEKATPAKVETWHQWWLVIKKNQRVALCKRADGSIWGGLWTLPIFESEDDLRAFTGQSALVALPEVRHKLTHRLIMARVYAWEVGEDFNLPEGWVWADGQSALGVAKPMWDWVRGA